MNPVEEQHIAELKVIGLLHEIDKLTAERDRLRGALEICADDHAEGGAHKVARQALEDTHD